MAFCQSCGSPMSDQANVCPACGEAKSGRPFGSTPGPAAPAIAIPSISQDEARGFLASLFDLSFTSFITTKLIKVLYVLGMIGAALGSLGFAFSGFKAGSVSGLITLVLAPVIFLFGVIYFRVMMELVMVIFRAAEHVAEIARQGRRA
jgi:hypothetical protein